VNWEALGAIAELLGAIAVFSTLAYLAVQIRQSNIVAREQAHYHMLQNQIGYFDNLANDINFLKTVYGSDLNADQIAGRQHEAHVISILFKWNWEYMRAKDGVYDEQTLPIQGWRTHYYPMGINRHWEQIKKWHNPEFVKFMDKEIIPYAVEV
jgi:hypothetical protein